MKSIEHFSAEVPDSGSHLTGCHPIQRGAVKSWDQVEKVWKNVLDELNLTPSDNLSTLLIQSNNPGASDRLKWTEMLFDTFHVPSLCTATSAPLSLYASGRTTGFF